MTPSRLGAWAELLRVSALYTVPGDALAGAAAVGVRPNRGTALAVGASLCLYEAGMALNDWADREEDAVDRPHRPIPSGRVAPGAALVASGGLTAAGLALAAGAGRPALAVAGALAATIWAYDLRLKHTPAGPATMAVARALDLLLGAMATGPGAPAAGLGAPPRTPVLKLPHSLQGMGGAPSTGWIFRAGTGSRSPRSGAHGNFHRGNLQPGNLQPGNLQPGRRLRPSGRGGVGNESTRPAPPALAAAAATLAAHTYAVTAVSRRETQGGSTAAPLAALATAAALATLTARGRPGTPTTLAATAYLRTTATPLLHAALNPSPPLTQRAVGGGIRAMIPLQAAIAARNGAAGTGAALIALVPLARKLSRKVSPT